jgi:hypothetical protein
MVSMHRIQNNQHFVSYDLTAGGKVSRPLKIGAETVNIHDILESPLKV